MSLINITNIEVLNNPAPFLAKFRFNITFECLADIPHQIEWRLVYIGSATDESLDQVLDEFQMGPLNAGLLHFTLQANPPDHTLIPQNELLKITAFILTVSYRKNEFFRVGYYVYNQYEDPELAAEPPAVHDICQIWRSILADRPRIMRTKIAWNIDQSHESQQECHKNQDSDGMSENMAARSQERDKSMSVLNEASCSMQQKSLQMMTLSS